MKKELDFCTLHLYHNYIVSHINDGETITVAQNDQIKKVALDFYGTRHFVYITHRINSYAVDPATYLATSKIETLVGVAVVSSDYKAKTNAEIEKLFFNKPFEIFNTLDKAISWADSILKKQ